MDKHLWKLQISQRRADVILTNHSLWPWKPSWLSFFTAMTMPVPGLAAVNAFSSIHPLKTQPKPPSPNTLSGRKFLVAVLSSLKKKLFKLEDCKISPSVLGVVGTEADETLLLLEPLKYFPSLLPHLDLIPANITTPWTSMNSSTKIRTKMELLATTNYSNCQNKTIKMMVMHGF